MQAERRERQTGFSLDQPKHIPAVQPALLPSTILVQLKKNVVVITRVGGDLGDVNSCLLFPFPGPEEENKRGSVEESQKFVHCWENLYTLA